MGLFARTHEAFLRRTAKWRHRRFLYAAITVAIIAPPCLLGLDTYQRVHADTTELALGRRQSVAKLGALAVRERLDHLAALGHSLATRVRLRELIQAGRWQEAIDILVEAPSDFRDVERIFLADLAGTLQADTPSLPGVVGRDFAFRDWYRGVTEHWRPYVTHPYQRTAEPRYNVIAVAIPITSRDGEPVGILVLQVKLDTFRQWAGDVQFEDEGILYFVAGNGHVVAHPNVDAQGQLVDFSGVSVVERVLRGDSDVIVTEATSGREASVSAFEPVARYGWGVVAEQGAHEAFTVRRSALHSVLLVVGVALLLAAVAAYVVISVLEALRSSAARKEALARAEAELEQLKLFNFVASHDLQEPLHKLTLFAGLLEDECGAALTPQGRAHLKRLRDASDRMRRLIEQMLALARVATRGQPREPLELDAVLRSVLADLGPQIAAAEAEIEVEPLPRVLADRGQMEVLFSNLIGNALKFQREDAVPHVRVACTQRGGPTCEIAIQDNGIGFEDGYADGYAERIFEPFQRLHGRQQYEGSGLGLAICSRIVQRHGGAIRVQSVPDQGSAFVVTLEEAPSARRTAA